MKTKPGWLTRLSSAPVHPLLFAAYPVLFLYSHDAAELGLQDIVLALGVAVGVVAALMVVLRLSFKEPLRAYVCLSVFTFSFFSYGALYDAVRRASTLPIPASALWIILTVIVIVALAKVRYDPRVVGQALNLAAVALVVMAMAGARPALSRRGTAVALPGSPVAKVGPSSVAKVGQLPDIYYIILDAYGRADILKELYGLDNTPFVHYLESRGFYVAPHALSNYPATALSLSSSLNMDYLPPGTNNVTAAGIRGLHELLRTNRVTAALKAAGYKVIFYPSIFPDLDGFPADVRVAGSGNMKSLIFDDELMKRTPIRSAESLLVALRAKAMGPGTRTGWIPTYGHALALHVARTQEAFKAVGTETRSSTPLFVMVHIVCPHPPFVFVGKDWQQKIDYSATNDVLGRDLTREQFIAGYRGQVEYTNTRMHEVVDRLLARPGPRPIIIVQGDHGPNLGRIDNREIMVPHERMSILDAYYVPENIRGNLYPTITPVNSFRIILNGLLGTNYEKVADDSYAPSASVTGGLELYREGAPAGSTPVQSQSGGAPVWKAD